MLQKKITLKTSYSRNSLLIHIDTVRTRNFQIIKAISTSHTPKGGFRFEKAYANNENMEGSEEEKKQWVPFSPRLFIPS